VSARVVTRFAPSPTGHLHVGGARTALFNWALARKLAGTYVLRIEDTDVLRSSDASVAGILADLAWIGVPWDEGPALGRIGGDPRAIGPFFQSQRLALYREAVDALVARDQAYPAFETPEELDALRRSAGGDGAFRYARPPDWDRARGLERAKTEPHVVRFRMPRTEIQIHDEILGAISFPADFLDDFVILKRDGFPTYHLGVVVDDERMGVTHVLRGQEHLNNTPRHVALQRALGYRTPLYAHLPLIQNPDGSKMSKRDKDKAARRELEKRFAADSGARARAESFVAAPRLAAWLADPRSQLEPGELDALADVFALDLPGVTIEDFRRGGYLPETLVNYLALLGWSPGEKLADGRDREHFDSAYLAERFDLARIGRGNAKFDRTKLAAFSHEQLAALSDAEWLARWQSWCERYAPEARARLASPERALWFAAAMRTRCRTLAEASAPLGPGRFALIPDDEVPYDEKAVSKWLTKGEPRGRDLLAEIRGLVGAIAPFEPAAIEGAVSAWCTPRGVGLGKVAQPLRVALTGSAASPPLGETLAILGRESVLARIDRCLSRVS
jgi:glutamyl-tRNA synthetase